MHSRSKLSSTITMECTICFEPGTAANPVFQKGCACRGNLGCAHLSCMKAMGLAMEVPPLQTHNWWRCSVCKLAYSGPVHQALAKEWYNRAVSAYDQSDAAKRYLIEAAENFSRSLWEKNEPEKFAVLNKALAEFIRRTVGNDSPEMLRCIGTQSSALQSFGDIDASIGAETRFRELCIKLKGRDHADTVKSESRINLLSGRPVYKVSPEKIGTYRQGILKLCEGDYEGAEPLILQTIDELHKKYGPDHKNTISAELNYSYLLLKSERREDSKKMFSQTAEKSLRSLGETHALTAMATQSLKNFFI